MFVLDANHLWAVTPGPDTTPFGVSAHDLMHLVVYYSSDGRTWSATTLSGNYPGRAPELEFVDPDHGYLLAPRPAIPTGSSRRGDGTRGIRTILMASSRHDADIVSVHRHQLHHRRRLGARLDEHEPQAPRHGAACVRRLPIWMTGLVARRGSDGRTELAPSTNISV
jgi:hypothetical protein